MVISGESLRSDSLKPKEVVSLLLDDEELEKKCKLKYLKYDFRIKMINDNINFRDYLKILNRSSETSGKEISGRVQKC